MKFKAMLLGLSVITALPAFAQKPVYLDTGKPIEERVKDALNRMTLEEKVKMIHAQSKFSSAGVPRLGIPEVWATDGPHGIRPEVLWDEWDQAGWTNDSCIAYPALTCLSATWNPEMSHLYGKSIGEEARYRKKDILLGPGVNIYRTPLNGRNFEYMGEPVSVRHYGGSLHQRCTREWGSCLCEALCIEQSGVQPSYHQCAIE